jgi:hypothetical protein
MLKESGEGKKVGKFQKKVRGGQYSACPVIRRIIRIFSNRPALLSAG